MATKQTLSRGFALLEALVAMVIVAAVGAALFALINTGLQGLNKAEAHVATTSIQPQVLAWVRTIDMDDLPARREASITLWSDEREYRAEASLERLHGPAMTTTGSGSPGIHQAALYDVTVTIYAHNRTLDQIRTRRTATRQVAAPPQF